MPLGPNQNLAAFQQLAKKAVSDTPLTSSGSSTYLGDRDLRHLHHAHSTSSTRISRSKLNINQQASPRPNQSVSGTVSSIQRNKSKKHEKNLTILLAAATITYF